MLFATLLTLSAAGCSAEETGPAVEWKEGWDATYAFNRELWEKELKANPKSGKKGNLELPARLVFLLESLLKKYPDDMAHRLAAYGELAELLVKVEARA